MTRVEQELKVGGAANYYGSFTTGDPVSGSSAGREFGGVGVVRAADPPRMLEYTRTYTDGIPCPEETVIRYVLEPQGDGTRLSVTHSGFRSQAMADQHAQGWQRVFAWLARYLGAGSTGR
jgi:uncharacterized protein YndB with AHSA1/START domain